LIARLTLDDERVAALFALGISPLAWVNSGTGPVTGTLLAAAGLFLLLRNGLISIRFAPEHVQWRRAWKVRQWPLDGSCALEVLDGGFAKGRWGGRVRDPLVITTSTPGYLGQASEHNGANDGWALPLIPGRYTRQSEWAAWLQSEVTQGRLRADEAAQQALDSLIIETGRGRRN
jgi:hypothetical protein